MTGHEYLDNLQKERSVDDTTLHVMRSTRDTIESHLRKTIGSSPRIYYAGSYGKSTMLDVYHDLDIVVYYSSAATITLKDIYWEVYGALNGTFVVRQKDVAIRLPYQSGFVVAIVPGRAQDDTFRYANLYRSETDSRVQTSIKVHIETVQQSGLRGTMRLMKLWNVRHSLGLRSFFIELLTARVLKNTTLSGYDDKLLAMFRYIVDNIQSVKIVDPANSNNIISDAIPSLVKQAAAYQAQQAIDARFWSEVVW